MYILAWLDENFLTDYLRCVTTSAPCKGQYQSGNFKQQQDSYNDKP